MMVLVLGTAGCALSQDAQPRPLPPKPPIRIPEGVTDYRVVVKFSDSVKARVDADGGLTSEAGADLSAVLGVAGQFGLAFTPVFHPDDRVEKLLAEAEQRSGKPQPDLRGKMFLSFAEKTDERVIEAADALQALEEVEYVSIDPLNVPPPCADISPPSGDHTVSQTYRTRAPGMSFDYAWATGAGRGRGIRVTDCERSWYVDHEDLCNRPQVEPGQTLVPPTASTDWNKKAHHGAAVLGIIWGAENTYGVTGLVPEAEVWVYPTGVFSNPDLRIERAIANAAADSSPGDIVVLELQQWDDAGNYAPAESRPHIRDDVAVAVSSGRIVVAAAGNGGISLDSSSYPPGSAEHDYYRAWETTSTGAPFDSGAIIVGASRSNGSHLRTATSNYGSRVDVHSWGENVFTLGWGWIKPMGTSDERQWYTDRFDQTSAATALVASACVSLQSYAVDRLCRRLEPLQMRQLLRDLGTGEVPGQNIGPFADMEAAIELLIERFPSDCRFIRGDCDGDGDIDTADGERLLRYLFEGAPDPPCKKACDADDTSVLEMTDGVLMVSAGSGMPTPFPLLAVCGTDPTNDGLGCTSYACP